MSCQLTFNLPLAESQVLFLWGPDGPEASWELLEHRAWGGSGDGAGCEQGGEGGGYEGWLAFSCCLPFLRWSVAVQRSRSAPASHSPFSQRYHLLPWRDSVYSSTRKLRRKKGSVSYDVILWHQTSSSASLGLCMWGERGAGQISQWLH